MFNSGYKIYTNKITRSINTTYEAALWGPAWFSKWRPCTAWIVTVNELTWTQHIWLADSNCCHGLTNSLLQHFINSGKTLIPEYDKCNRQDEVCNRENGRNKWRSEAVVPFAMHNIGKWRRKLKSFQCMWNSWKKEGKPVEVTSHRALVYSSENWN